MSNETIEPHYQSGVRSVDHRDIDASGDGHPFGDDPKEFEADLRPLIREFADDLYESWEETIREYLANAETACLKVRDYVDAPNESPFDEMIVEQPYEPRIEVTWDRSEQKVTIKDNGIGMAAVEVDQVFRYIGRSAARDDGAKSGAFGMGALSFVKFIGTDNTMVMTTHSRLNDDNASYLVSLAGVEPIMGTMDDDEYGTKFQMTQKSDDFDVRDTVEKYAQWMRVTVIYREIDEDGAEVFNEDWGDRQLYDDYERGKYVGHHEKPGAFEAYCSPDASDRTLLLSMEIDRNCADRFGAPYSIDVRLLDESGKVVESSNGNEGLMPCSDHQYREMLMDARDEYVPEHLLSSDDIVARRGESGDEEVYLVDESVLDSDQPLPVAEYVTDSEELDSFGPEEVILGPHQGRTVVDRDEWQKLPEGRASQFVPESELEEYDVETGDGDLCLPEPTTNRSSLQQNDKFWKYLANYFSDDLEETTQEYREKLQETDDVVGLIKDIQHQSVSRFN
jgi:hypothetical protein